MRQVKVELVDDIDGSPAQHTVEFALDGVNYVIDLSAEHERTLRNTLAPYVKVARTSGAGHSPHRSRQGSDNSTLKIRQAMDGLRQARRASTSEVEAPPEAEEEPRIELTREPRVPTTSETEVPEVVFSAPDPNGSVTFAE